MVELVELQAIAYVAQIVGVIGTLTAAFIAVRSYINANKRAEEAKKKEQATQELALKAQQQNLETRQAQLFMSSMFEKLSSPEFAKANIKLDKNKPKTVQDLAKIFDEPELSTAWKTVWWVYEGLGVLIHEDLVDIRLVARYIGGSYKAEWEAWGPVFKLAKVEWNHPRMADESEYLYDRLMAFGRENPEYHIIESKYTR